MSYIITIKTHISGGNMMKLKMFLQFYLSRNSFVKNLYRMLFYYFPETLLQNNLGQIEITCYDQYRKMEAFLEANF